jgi:receptor-type tyrosine-protein phosphatase Q
MEVHLILLSMLLFIVPSGSPVMINIEAINSSSLRLSWVEPPAEEQNGIITSHSINVTILETEERLSFTAPGIRFELHDLHPFYTYSVTIAAATVNGTGPYSAVFSIQLPPDGESICVGLLP